MTNNEAMVAWGRVGREDRLPILMCCAERLLFRFDRNSNLSDMIARLRRSLPISGVDSDRVGEAALNLYIEKKREGDRVAEALSYILFLMAGGKEIPYFWDIDMVNYTECLPVILDEEKKWFAGLVAERLAVPQ